MPLYEYYCSNCEYQVDIIHKVAEKKEELCPSCKKQKLKRKTSLTSFQLKGGGWYKDSYSKKVEKPTPVKKPTETKAQKKDVKASS